jgi:hypothetical protein
MKSRSKKTPQEPMGIIISGTPSIEQPPVFAAYVWAPAPAASEDEPQAR